LLQNINPLYLKLEENSTAMENLQLSTHQKKKKVLILLISIMVDSKERTLLLKIKISIKFLHMGDTLYLKV
jgi:hypothetical protein